VNPWSDGGVQGIERLEREGEAMSIVTVDVRELPGKLSELVTLAAAGTEVIVRDGAATAKLIAPAKREWVFNMHPGAMVMREDFNDPIDEEAFLQGDF
jgi:antitoxin (DNA-binding transcriptional repressor) of toxin-antitoxin stability system